MAPQIRSPAPSLKGNGKLSMVEDAETHENPINMDDFAFEEETEAEKKLLRKIDMFLLPTIWLVYLLSYMVGEAIHHCRTLTI